MYIDYYWVKVSSVIHGMAIFIRLNISKFLFLIWQCFKCFWLVPWSTKPEQTNILVRTWVTLLKLKIVLPTSEISKLSICVHQFFSDMIFNFASIFFLTFCLLAIQFGDCLPGKVCFSSLPHNFSLCFFRIETIWNLKKCY